MLDLESLLSPLSDDAPSGADLEYDPVFMQLEQAGAGRPEQQFGDTVIPAEPPDWRTVQDHALAVALRTRDLRIGIWLLRCGARLQGIGGAVAGLQLVHGLVSRFWPTVHPQLDASDGNDPTMRISTLAPLSSALAVMADLRSAAIVAARGGLTVREVELGLGLAAPVADESSPSEAGVLEALRVAIEGNPDLVSQLRTGREAAEGIAQTLNQELGDASGPDLTPLLRLTKALDEAARRACGVDAETAVSVDGASDATGGTVAGPRGSGAIESRDDVIRTIDRLCDWIERNEPSNPAPLLLRRAQRLMSKSFVDIVRDLVPDGLDQIEKLAGVDLRSG